MLVSLAKWLARVPVLYRDHPPGTGWLTTPPPRPTRGPQSHVRGMSVALKNNGPMAKDLVDTHNMVVSEQCIRYGE